MPTLAAITNDDALRLLPEALKAKGTLRIITDQLTEDGERVRDLMATRDAARTADDQDRANDADNEIRAVVPARFADFNPLADPALYVCHDVVRLEGPDASGAMTAYSGEGDWCQGQPAALLRRLREAGVAAALAAAEQA